MGLKVIRVGDGLQLVAGLTILCQPALILIDNGHFQYNSIMLGLTLWSINAFQSGHDLIGSTLFVTSLGFKQMALYYSPGIFAYLFGKCLWLGGRQGLVSRTLSPLTLNRVLIRSLTRTM
jgi:alpha-1,3-glucosyltransferase